jgi:hypothetical protein
MVGELAASSDSALPNRASPEIEHFHRPVGRHHDIGRFQVAMHDAFLMRASSALEICFAYSITVSTGSGPAMPVPGTSSIAMPRMDRQSAPLGRRNSG